MSLPYVWHFLSGHHFERPAIAAASEGLYFWRQKRSTCLFLVTCKSFSTVACRQLAVNLIAHVTPTYKHVRPLPRVDIEPNSGSTNILLGLVTDCSAARLFRETREADIFGEPFTIW